jgi:hypothetical protein
VCDTCASRPDGTTPAQRAYAAALLRLALAHARGTTPLRLALAHARGTTPLVVDAQGRAYLYEDIP